MEKADAMDEKSIKVVGPYNVGKTIGSGSTGKVKLGTHSMDGSKVAIKMLRKDSVNLKPSMRKKVEREIAILKLIDHPHVLKLVDVYETDLFLFIILEHVEGGELFDYLVSKSKLPLHEALHFFQQIIMGLEYCQSLMICHRDLKPENLLLDLRGNIKIADFGMASLNPKGSLLQTSCGSPHYASPQVVQGIKYNGMQSDIWSCGVILYALVFGKLPFDDSNIKRLLAKVKSGVFHIPEDTEPFVRDLITRMIVVDPDQRITIDEIKRHPWFTSNNNKLAIAPQLDKALIATSLKLDTLNCEILADLQSLGWGTEDEIFSRLVCQEYPFIVSHRSTVDLNQIRMIRVALLESSFFLISSIISPVIFYPARHQSAFINLFFSFRLKIHHSKPPTMTSTFSFHSLFLTMLSGVMSLSKYILFIMDTLY
eukprot:TRINITY_DN5214_c0_g1_i2.p1 TRINITY_DN5214_c0_g1~~TRINITY_DN5214_c0_g1_i2.p1  ORF type:complete len:426 (-),score=87.43 TRINITY_DN5214_c0_g1_i2:74-1351(-)